MRAHEGEDTASLRGNCAGFYLAPNDDLFLPQSVETKLYPRGDLFADHGTMVSSLVTQGQENIKIYPAAGDFKNALYYQRASEVIDDYQIKVSNISLSFVGSSNPHQGFRESYREAQNAIDELIYSHPETLFVVASGNGHFRGFNANAINLRRHRHFPASLNYPNIFSVGAINSAEIEVDQLDQYQMTFFSNYGIRNVDILAPGLNLDAGAVGGGSAPATGTSFATPYIINQAIVLSDKAPHLSYFQIKEIMMKTVYIPNIDKALEYDLDWRDDYTQEQREKAQWFPVRSGGIYHPERAMKVAEILADFPGLEINQAIEQVFSKEQYQKRLELWQQREIAPKN